MSASGSGRTRFWVVAAMLGLAVAAALAGYGIWSRNASVAQLQQTADDAAVPRVQSASPKPGPAEDSLTLPGEVVAWNEAQIYGQVSGYVSQWLKDYGAPVQKGEVLATIDTPSLDASVRGQQGATGRRASAIEHRRTDGHTLQRAHAGHRDLAADHRHRECHRRGAEGSRWQPPSRTSATTRRKSISRRFGRPSPAS